jgi:hypothetical protein
MPNTIFQRISQLLNAPKVPILEILTVVTVLKLQEIVCVTNKCYFSQVDFKRTVALMWVFSVHCPPSISIPQVVTRLTYFPLNSLANFSPPHQFQPSSSLYRTYMYKEQKNKDQPIQKRTRYVFSQ